MKRISACWTVVLGMLFTLSSLMSAGTFANQQILQIPPPGKSITKYTEPVPTFVGARVSATNLTVSMEEFQQKILPTSFYNALPAPFTNGTYVWGYNKVNSAGPNYPAFTIEARQGVPTTATYLNNLIKTNGGLLEVLLNNSRWNGLKESTMGIPDVTPQPIAASFPSSTTR